MCALTILMCIQYLMDSRRAAQLRLKTQDTFKNMHERQSKTKTNMR